MSAMGRDNDVRAGLEHRPRRPFAVSPGAALEALALDYGERYVLGHDGERYQAHRDGRDGPLTGVTPDELSRALAADCAAHPARPL